jgi:hypothetical protein
MLWLIEMSNLKEIAEKTERKLSEQNHEFNTLRDRCVIVSGFGIALATAFFSFWSNINSPYNHIIASILLVSLISIGIMIYAAFSNPLNRGMDTKKVRETIEYGEDYFLNEIAYNLISFEENAPILKKLQCKLNLGLTTQAMVLMVSAFCIYFNQIQYG